MTIYSQRDKRWSGKKLGSGPGTIGKYGCTLTCFSMVTNIAPDLANDRLVEVKAFQGELIVWSKVNLGLPVNPVSNPVVWSQKKVEELTAQGKFVLVHVDFDGIISTPNDMHWAVFLKDKLLDPWDGKEYPWSRYPIRKRYTVVEPIGIIADDMPVWVKGYFQERGIDLEQEGDARARLGEVFDESVKYQTTDKARLKAERDLAEARGDATKFEESLIQARKEIGKLEDEIRDIQAKVLSRDQRISELETAVTRLEGLIPATGTVIISSEEYASLKAKALQGVKFWGLVTEIIRRLLGRR